MAKAALGATLAFALACTTEAAEVKLVPVMVAGSTSVGCTQGGCKYAAFRIPGLVAAGNNTLIAAAEGRKFGCGDFGGQHDLVIRRSTDGGETWGQLRTILDAVSFPPWSKVNATAKPDTGNAVWDPTPLWDARTGKVWLFFNGPGRENPDCAVGLCGTWAMSSIDLGVTWSPAVNMTAKCQRPGPIPGFFASNTPGNGHGVQLSSGRLVVPMYGGLPAATHAGASICFSDDGGEHWQAAAYSPTTGNLADEIEIAELNANDAFPPSSTGTAAATLYMTIRNDGAQGGHRQYSISTDSGSTWGERLNVQVPDPGCKGSVVQAPAVKAMILANAGSCTSRVNQTVYLSIKNGAPGSWVYRQFVHAESGYSTLQMT